MNINTWRRRLAPNKLRPMMVRFCRIRFCYDNRILGARRRPWKLFQGRQFGLTMERKDGQDNPIIGARLLFARRFATVVARTDFCLRVAPSFPASGVSTQILSSYEISSFIAIRPMPRRRKARSLASLSMFSIQTQDGRYPEASTSPASSSRFAKAMQSHAKAVSAGQADDNCR